MSQPKEHHKKPFSWGVRLGTINLYKSFTLDDIEYSLYDTVYLRRNNDVDVGKVVKILEMENLEKKVEVVWFFKPGEIVNWLGDAKPLRKEIFLACGEGKGLSNVNPLEAIVGKCNVVCLSRDQRNPQPTEKELGEADYIFCRTFDVGTQKILEEFPSLIAGIKVDHFFNRRVFATPSVGSELKAQPRARSEKGDCRFDVPVSTSSNGQMKSSIKDRTLAGGNIKRSVQFLSTSPSDIGPTKKIKLISSSGNRSDDALPNTPTKASGEEKLVKASCRETTDVSTRKSVLSKTSEFTGKGPVNKQNVGTSVGYKYTEITRKPGLDSSKWLKLEVWGEGRLAEANENGTLLVLENLDPSFAASEVEDIVWHVFKENVRAKMVQSTAYSSLHSGQALIIFKTKEAANKIMHELISGCLVLGDGRPIVGRRRFLKKVGAADRFVGHLSIERTRFHHRQREEWRNAVSTSHFSQGNTIEFEMAIQWRSLQEKSRRWWKALQEEQGKEMEALMKQMKIHLPE